LFVSIDEVIGQQHGDCASPSKDNKIIISKLRTKLRRFEEELNKNRIKLNQIN